MFRIGEFSKIAHVSGSLLRYYDGIGLLKPAHVDSFTAYRYYSIEQLPRLNRIIALKELGIPLEQITRMLDENIKVENIRNILLEQKNQIEQALREENERLRRIEIRLEQLEGRNLQESDVVLKTIPEQTFYSIREILPTWEHVGKLMQEVTTVLPKQIKQKSLSHLTVILHSETYENVNLDVEVGYLLTQKIQDSLRIADGRILRTRDLPPIEIGATTLRFGSFDNSIKSYGAIGLWIEKNNYHIVGSGREVFLRLPQSDEAGEAMTEIQFPVARVESE